MRPPIVSAEGHAEICEVAVKRAQLLTDDELAHKHHISRRRVQQIMQLARQMFLLNCVVSNSMEVSDTAIDSSPKR